MQAYEIAAPGGIDRLHLATRSVPAVNAGEVLVQVGANSLNYRDYLIVSDPGARGIKGPRIPNSDGAGTVLAVGDGVTRFKPGDRVTGCFFQAWDDGEITAQGMASALGGAVDGVLAEQVVLREAGLVATPAHLDDGEAATLPCAALTAWHALVEKGNVRAGDSVLLLGTGGVSIFALQFAKLHGARVIITSGSDEKLERARRAGADDTVNYRSHPDWQEQVLALTDGRGVDHVIEVGGAGTLTKSVQAVRVSGHIALIGVLTGGQIDPTLLMRKSIRLNGIYVGSRAMFERMNRAIVANGLHPVIDRSFGFAEAPAAFRHLEAAGHFGKVAIRL